MFKGILERLAWNSSGRKEDNLSVAQSSGKTIPTSRAPVDLLRLLADRPLDPNLHLEYAAAMLNANSPYLALAELNTARFLGAASNDIAQLDRQLRASLPDPLLMNHNQYYRLISLASEVQRIGGHGSLSVLDVGGGDGRLAAFLPDAAYCLAEPTTNGISGLDLPFDDGAFDYVVSCHVLEHVPPEERSAFLDQLLSKSRRGLVMLNPFQVEGTHVDSRLRLIIEITGAQWAKEHLDCGLPTLEDVARYAESRKLTYTVKPNGALATALAFVFMDHFAAMAGNYDQWMKVNAFFNKELIKSLDSSEYPNAYLVTLERP